MKTRDYDVKVVRRNGYNSKWNILFIIVSVLLIAGLGYMVYRYYQQEAATQAHWLEVSEQVGAEKKAKEQEELEAAKQAAAEEEARRLEREETDSFYQKLQDGFDVNVLVLGDEIATTKGTSEEKYSWANTIASFWEKKYEIEVNLTNLAIPQSNSYAGYASVATLDDRVEYDLAVICYGKDDSEENVAQYYEAMIRMIRNNYRKCSIITLLEATGEDYPAQTLKIQEVAEHYNIPVVDMIAAFVSGENGEYADLTIDGIQPNDQGHQLYAMMILQMVEEFVAEGKEYDASQIMPVGEDMISFDNFVFYDATEFERNDTSFVLQFEDEKLLECIGIEYSLFDGTNICEIMLDDQLVNRVEEEYEGEEPQLRRIPVVNEESVQSKLEIRFATLEQADSFEGIIMNMAE